MVNRSITIQLHENVFVQTLRQSEHCTNLDTYNILHASIHSALQVSNVFLYFIPDMSAGVLANSYFVILKYQCH